MVHCSHCAHPSDIDATSNHAWCPRCKRVFNVPLFYVPGWVAGVVLVLMIAAAQ